MTEEIDATWVTGYLGERVIADHIQGSAEAYNSVTSSANNTVFESITGRPRLEWMNYAIEQRRPYDVYLRSAIHMSAKIACA